MTISMDSRENWLIEWMDQYLALTNQNLKKYYS